MTIDASRHFAALSARQSLPTDSRDTPADPLRDAFTDFVGESLFGQMLSAMRSTVKQPAYFGGGQAEEIFQSQMDQVLVQKLSDASADRIADPMYELFRLGQPQ